MIADRITREVLGIGVYLARIEPRSPAAAQRHRALGGAALVQDSTLQGELQRLRALDEVLTSVQVENFALSLGALPDLKRSFRRLDAGEVLRDGDLFEIKRFLFHGAKVLEIAGGIDELPSVESETYRVLRELMDAIHPEESPTARFVLSDELDTALADARKELASTRQTIRQRRDELEEQILSRLNGKFDIHGRFRSEKPSVSDELLVEREGHLELRDQRLEQLREAQGRQCSQVERLETAVRRRLTEAITAHRREINRVAEALISFDLRVARVELRRSFDGCWPKVVEGAKTPFVSIEEGRDFLLVESLSAVEVQSVGVRLEQPATVVSGPNMGGKSALLRLIGMAQWCAQMALPVAATSVECTAVERVIYVGSDQGLELESSAAQVGLSSFGREVRRFVEFWEEQGPLLWLLDEPARGTHPEEGARLAERIVVERMNRGDRLVVATHFPQLADAPGVARLQVEGLRIDEEELRREIASGDGTGESLQAILRRCMDYRVRPVNEGQVPRDAAAIARALGLDLDD